MPRGIRPFASATTSHITFSYAARQRMQNRARL
ncbi:hypothetical protein ACUOAQ_22110, partial [Escherichia sp. SP-MK]